MKVAVGARTSRWAAFALSVGLSACGGGGGGGGGNGGGGNGMGIPGATLTSLSPPSIEAGSPPFILTVNGSGFVAGGSVSWNGANLGPYTFVSSSRVTVLVNPSLLTGAGNASIVATIPTPMTQPSNALMFTINPFTSSACALFGMYDFFFTGFDNNGPVTIGGDFGVDANGNVSGEEDFKDMVGMRAAEPITGGSCKNSAMNPNAGTITLITAAQTLTYSFAAQSFPQAGKTGGMAVAAGANGIGGSGRFFFTPPAGFFSGDYVLGLAGNDSKGARMTLIGRFTDSNNNSLSTPGTLSAGMVDINDAGATSSVPITGSVAVPDVYSRSLVTLHVGAQTLQLALYVKNSQLGVAVDVDAVGSGPLLAGFMNSQSNPGTYGPGHLNAPVVFSTWAATPGPPAISATTVGILSNFNSVAKTFDLQLDAIAGGVASATNLSVVGATYDVASNGRGTAAFTAAGTPYSYVFYLDTDNDGYILDTSLSVAYGFFEAQANGPFANSSINGTFSGGTWFSSVAASPNNVASITLNNGLISGSLNGMYAVDASGTGRGTASVDLPLFGSKDLVFYVVGPGAIEVMGSDPIPNDAIAWLHQ
jgi:hypothetical protein